MGLHKLARATSLALAIGTAVGLGLFSASVADAAVAHSTMSVTRTGTITRFESKRSFTISAGSKSYVVTTDDMTRVKLDDKTGKVSALRKGETVTVKGPLEMHTIRATSVVEGM